MADTREEDNRALSGLRSLAVTLDYTEKSWIETKETLDKLKTWALVQENRYFYSTDFRKLFRPSFWVYLGVRTCELFLCFVAVVRVRVCYVDFFLFFVLRHWCVSKILTPRQSQVFQFFELLCHNFDQGNMVCGNSVIPYPPPPFPLTPRQ